MGLMASSALVVTPRDQLGPRSKEILLTYLENPTWTHKQIGDRVGVSRTRVTNVFNANRFIAKLKGDSARRMTWMVPMSVNSVEYCIKQNRNLDTKFKASVKILEDQKIIGPSSMNVTVTDSRTLDEVRASVMNAQTIGANVIEGELA